MSQAKRLEDQMAIPQLLAVSSWILIQLFQFFVNIVVLFSIPYKIKFKYCRVMIEAFQDVAGPMFWDIFS